MLSLLLSAVLPSLRDRASLQLELIALRHQLLVLERKRTTQSRLTRIDRFLWVWLYRLWPGCLDVVVIVKPDTVIRWHRRGFRLFWTWKSRPRRRGCPPVPQEVRVLIRRMSRENALWGAPRIHGELLKLGIEISQATVSNYLVRHPRPPSQTWRTFLANHADGLASIDLLVVPTATFRVLYAFIVLRHERRRVVHFDVTSHPTAAWLGATACRGVSVGNRTAIPDPRSRRGLWDDLPRSAGDDEHRRGADGATITVAERLCRARHRIDPAGMPRSCHCPERASPATDPVVLLRLLPPIPDPPFARQGLPRSASCLSAGCGQDCSFPATRRPSSSLRKARGLIRAAIGSGNAVAVTAAPGGRSPWRLGVLFRAHTCRFDEAHIKLGTPADRRSALYPPQRHG